MLKRILVPTDGSPESGKALTLALQIAKPQGAEILLVRVGERPVWPELADDGGLPPDVYDQLIQQIEQEARADLTRLSAQVQAEGVPVSALLLWGSPTGALLDCEEQEHPDLVAMATHGRTGLERFALGSVTDRMVREGSAPVLVLRKSSEASTKLDHALVTLDGSGVSEGALPMVHSLAGKPLLAVTLLRVVADASDRGPASTYLDGVAARLTADGLQVQTRVEVGSPQAMIEAAARDVDLVILCTHGRGGLDRLRHGSVAEHVVREVDKPCLVVRTATEASKP